MVPAGWMGRLTPAVMMVILLFQVVAADDGFAGTAADSGPILTLEKALDRALSDNPSLAAARERVSQARAAVDQADAALWPVLDAGLSVSRVWTAESQAPLFTGDNPEDYLTPELTLQWQLFDGFSRRFSRMAARHGQAAGEHAEKDVKRLLCFAVASAYYSAQLQRENVKIARADEAFNQRQLKEAKARFDAGAGAWSDVLNFRVQANSARAGVIAGRNNYENSLSALARLMGDPRARLDHGVTLAELPEEDPGEMTLPEGDTLVKAALARRPDLSALSAQVAQAKAQVGQARGALYPAVGLSAAMDARQTGEIDFNGDDLAGSVGLGVSYRLFDGGTRKARVVSAGSREAELRSDLADLRIRITSEVHQALISLEKSRDQLRLQRANARLVEETRDLTDAEYRAGQTSLVRLNQAQRDLTQSRSRLALARVSLRLAWEELRSVTAQPTKVRTD